MIELELDNLQKVKLRDKIALKAYSLLGIPYEYGAEWHDLTVLPSALDCSELVEGVYNSLGLRMPDGSQNQYDFVVKGGLQVGALAFFGRNANPSQIYHVGIVAPTDEMIIEARAFDPNASFETGKVIARSRHKWEAYKNFVGYGIHPKLI